MAKPELESTGDVVTHNQMLPGEIIIGSLVAIDNEHRPMVDFAENISDAPLLALATIEIHKKHIGRQVALLFANGNPDRKSVV